MFKKNLTIKQRLFIKEYLIHRNASKAAKAAGYSCKTARSIGSRLLTNVYILEEIECGISEQLAKIDIYANDILQTLKRIALADLHGNGSICKLRALELLGNSLGIFEKSHRKARCK